jgi:RNA polymerase sigma-70 factor (ECF subfamily)
LQAETVNEMLGDEITSAIQALPVDFRMIIILCDLEEFSYEEMAKILNIPIGTVRSRLHRARAMLKETLASYALKKGYKTDMLSA